MSDFPEVMTIEQVAEYLQLHPQVIYRHVKAGTLPASRIGRTIRFKKSLLDTFLENDGWATVQKFFSYVKQQRSGSATRVIPAQANGATAAAAEKIPAPEASEDSPPDRQGSSRFTADVD